MKKTLMVIFLTFSVIITSILPAFASTETYQVKILDNETKEAVTNANVELVVIRENLILKKTTNDNGYINLSKDEYGKLQNVGIYALVQKGYYKAESSFDLVNNLIYVTPSSIASNNNITTYGATDWNTVKSEYDQYIWVPYYRIPTYGGLTAKVSFNNSYSGGWTISGGNLFSSSYASVTLDDDSYTKSLSNSKGKYWLNIHAKTRRYKITQQNTTGQTRVIYIVDNKVYELNGSTSSASFGTPTTIRKTIGKGNTGYTAGFGISSTVSFTLSGSLKTKYGSIKGSMKISSTQAVKRYYKSTGTYYYEIGDTAILRK